MPALRLPAAALLLTIAAASGSANAETVLRLTWTPSTGPAKVCEYRTDANGVSMASDGALVATGTFSGSDCPTGTTPVSDPSITNGITTADIPASTTVGANHTISWTANADSCSYAGSSLPGAITSWPVSGAQCTSAATCADAHNVGVTIPNVTGTYRFQLSCTKIGSTVTATSFQDVVVTGGGGGGDNCINTTGITRQTFGTVMYNDLSSRETDLTLYENVFGHNISGGPPRIFPGTANLNQRIMIPRNQYVALKFTVPVALPNQTWGQYRFEETQQQTPRMSFTISKSCGDFSPTATPPLTTAQCVINNGAVNSTLGWGYYLGATTLCQLVPGESYYLNIIHAPLGSNVTNSHCTGTCGNTMQSMKMGGAGWPASIDEPQ